MWLSLLQRIDLFVTKTSSDSFVKIFGRRNETNLASVILTLALNLLLKRRFIQYLMSVNVSWQCILVVTFRHSKSKGTSLNRLQVIPVALSNEQATI